MLMDIFKQVDKKGQLKVKSQLSQIFKEYNPQFTCHYADGDRVDIDMVMDYDDHLITYNFECKDRTYNHNWFNGEWFIEEDKWAELDKKGNNSFYANTFKDNYLVIWKVSDLKKEELKSEYRLLPATTINFTHKVPKLVYLLPVEKAVYCQPINP